MRITVVVPTFNEADNLEPFLRRVRASMPDACVLVVDDNSPDGTGDLAERLAAELGGIEVRHRTTKEGLGSAYRDGFARALAGHGGVVPDVIVSIDADLSHDPAAMPALVARLAAGTDTDTDTGTDTGADMVIGSRYVPGGRVVNWPLHRRLLSRWGNRYTGWILGVGVADCTSGYRAYRVDALRLIDPAATTAEGYAFFTELVRTLVAAGGTVAEAPITFVDRRHGASKMSWRIIVESMVLVTRWGIADRWGRRRGRPTVTPRTNRGATR